MEKQPAGKKPAATKKPAAARDQHADTIVNADGTLGPVDRPDPISVGATEMFAQDRDDDVDATAASFLMDEPAPAPPPRKPAGKPRPDPNVTVPTTDDSEAPPGDKTVAGNLGQTADFGSAPAAPPPGSVTEAPDDAVSTAAPKGGATRMGTAGAKGATRQPGASDPGAAKAPMKSVLGDYKLLKKLGAGGMGTVYLAEQISLERKVALKVLSKELAGKKGFVERFQREARLMARLDHPNILRCHDVGEVAGNHYLALDFVEGGSVEDRVKQLGKFAIGDAVHVTLACARALEHAHELNMIHRDVKPDNLLLTAKGVVKLADLGLAKATDDDLSLTKTGTGAGTPLYMAPEQARDVKHVDHRTDIYAMGCMLYYFLVGQLPFTGETLVQVIAAKEKGKFTPARRANADVPQRLDLIIDKMLAPDPRHRYQSCTELITDLEGLGVANQHLSFMGAAPAATKGAPSVVPKVPTQQPQRAAARPAQQTVGPAAAARTGMQDESAEAPEGWYLVLPLPGGKSMTQKVTREEMAELIKKGDLTPNTKVCRTPTGSRRAAATYPEINSLILALSSKGKADQKTSKYRELYSKIEEEGERHRRAKKWKRLFSGVKGFAGFVLWMCVILAVLAGGAFLVWKYLI